MAIIITLGIPAEALERLKELSPEQLAEIGILEWVDLAEQQKEKLDQIKAKLDEIGKKITELEKKGDQE